MENMTRKEEILLILMEECAEVAQQASKCIRFGGEKNDYELAKEIGDLICMVDLLKECGSLNEDTIFYQSEAKRKKLEKYSNIFKDVA
jgi:NTP pyrophosphatase (non-canonical NTP hydrolase)